MRRYSLGIDIGGTFTDIVVYDHESETPFNHKELTTAEDPVRGVVSGIRKLFQRHRLNYYDVGRVVHATTLFTNALIERRGAKTGMIVTSGFRDILETRREHKYELYNVFIELPRPLVPRSLSVEVGERIAADGTIVSGLNIEELLEASDQLVAKGVDSIAIVFLHAYANSSHEKAAADAVSQRHPNLFISASHEVAPEIREYERASTTVANAYVKPLAARYLDRLASEVADLGIGAPLFLMLSSGGLTNVDEARRVPARLLESGPAAGALAAAFIGRDHGATDILAFDMGGTTAKLAVIEEGEPLVAHSFEAARERRFFAGSGFPLKISTIELIEIGAGGGSIAGLDDLGLLKVGPQSAGSDPGPACYERGGVDATVTDANLVLGYLDPAYFAGGSIRIDRAAAETALGRLAAQASLTVTDLAWGIHDVVNETMASAARVHVAERGKDARRHALLVTGGGGPLHGGELARKLGVSTLICPKAAGVASALGLLVAPARVDRVATIAQRVKLLDWAILEDTFAGLEREAQAVIAETGLASEAVSAERFADMRYVGQGFEIVVPLPEGPYESPAGADILNAFEKAYCEIFAQPLEDVAVEIINIRVSVKASPPESRIVLNEREDRPVAELEAALKSRRSIYCPEQGGFVDAPVYDRGRLRPGMSGAGPAVVEEPESTLIVSPSSRFVVDAAGNLIVHIEATRSAELGGNLDAVTLEILWRRLITIVDEASAALVRSAFSTVLRESDDFSCVLTDAHGRSVAQATKSIPAFIGTLPATVKHFLNEYPEEALEPGDILITNDPWKGTGHLFDINVGKPIFYQGRLVGFAASTAHAAEIGGNLDVHGVKDVFEEGFYIPIMKLFEAGKIDQNVMRLLRSNVRMPDQVVGDLYAQINGLDMMERRLTTLLSEFGLSNLDALAAEIQRRSEQAMRDSIRALPDGTYRYALDTDGLKTPVHLEMALTIAGDEVHIDLEGSSSQVEGAINVPFPYTYAFTAFGVKCAVSPQAPNNEGSFLPISVAAPAGSIVNSTFPSSGGQRVNTGHYLPIAVFGALAQVIPERVAAGAGSPLWSCLQTGVKDGKPYANKFFFNGGTGATSRCDGVNVLSWPSNVSSVPTEMVEQQAPFRIHFKQFRKGSGGKGRFRGGTGQELLFECLSEEPIHITFNADRTKAPAPGIGGGEAGACGEVRLNDKWMDTRHKLALIKGDLLLIRTPAGGGYGPAAERETALIEHDRTEGYD